MKVFLKCFVQLIALLGREKPKIILKFFYLLVLSFFWNSVSVFYWNAVIILEIVKVKSPICSTLNNFRVLCITRWHFFWLLDLMDLWDPGYHVINQESVTREAVWFTNKKTKTNISNFTFSKCPLNFNTFILLNESPYAFFYFPSFCSLWNLPIGPINSVIIAREMI